MTNKTNNKGTALVTGASSGIGAAIATEFARNGHDVILVARSAHKLQSLAEDLQRKHSIKATVIPQDLSATNAAEALLFKATELGLVIDILVNNAGLLYEGPFWETPEPQHQQLLQVNIGTLMALSHRVLPGMLERGQGRIMNIASTSAFQPIPYLSTYAASKAFVLSFSEALNIELKDKGVTVTALCPGFTETDMIAKEDGKSMNVPFVKNMSAEEVAQQGYAACMAGKPLYINGASNRALITLGKHQPRWLQRLITELVGKQNG